MPHPETALYHLPKDYPDWTLLAAIDEGAAYEVDITEVWKTPVGYAIVTASGCSCWDGDYDFTVYADIPAVITALGPTTEDVGSRYNPSTRGATELVAQLSFR